MPLSAELAGAMTDGVLQTRVEAERARAAELDQRLAPRREREVAELTALASEEKEALDRTTQAKRSISQAREGMTSLALRKQELVHGLSRAERSWLRLGEPVLAALLLFFSLIAIGLTVNAPWQTAALEAGGFLLGGSIALRRRWTSRR